jgi:tetratricopeptide (TPR) repeat protein
LQIVEELHSHALSLRNHGYDVDGLLARICVQQAKGYRQMMEYQRSRQFYSEALEAYLTAAQKKPDEYTYYLHRVAMVIAGGSGFINLRRGLLTRATLGIRSARMMLLHSENVVYKVYLQTLNAGILRAQSGYNSDGLSAARAQLENAYRCLNEIGHFRYMLMTLNELVLSCIFLKDFPAAEGYVKEIRRLAQGKKDDGTIRNVRMTDNFRWLVTADLRTSLIRLHQGKAEEARDIAKQARADANKRNLKRNHILGLILEGEALFEMGEYEESRAMFLKARDRNREEKALISDPHLHVATLLFLSRIGIKTNNYEVAQSHYNESQSYGKMEQQWVEDLRIQTEKELTQRVHPFIIKEIPTDGYHEAIGRMRFWMFKEAQKKHGRNLTKIAEELKMTRGVLYKWFKDPSPEETLNENEYRHQKNKKA